MSEEASPVSVAAPTQTSLRELGFLFLRLGTTAFGGPAAHIAMMEDEVVRRRRWLSHEQFLDLLGATNLIPGPNSTEMAIHIGRQRAGWPGLLVAGGCFILPAALIVTSFAWAYVQYGSLPQAAGILYGVKPVIVAVVVQALWALGRSAVKTRFLALVGLAAVMLSVLGVHELAILFGAGVGSGSRQWLRQGKRKRASACPSLLYTVPFLSTAEVAAQAGAAAASFDQGSLFLFF